jgi:hypothetical protein
MASLLQSADEAPAVSPIHALRDHLEAARLEAITQAADSVGRPDSVSVEAASRIGHLHMALLAVRDEIEAHTPKLGAGSEQPLQ